MTFKLEGEHVRHYVPPLSPRSRSNKFARIYPASSRDDRVLCSDPNAIEAADLLV